MIHAVWVEIPVRDIDRALKFYQMVFALESVEIATDDVRRTATLMGGTQEGKAGVSLNLTKNFEPSDKGAFVYYDTGEDFEAHLSRVEPAGGKIIEPKTSMGSAGYYASIQDTEGNLFALYSYK